jgi:hypothetical protein
MRPSLSGTVLLAALMLAGSTISSADDLPDCQGHPVSLSVTPAQPACDDVITLGATQWLNDSCWTAEPPVFSSDPPDFAFDLASVDLWDSSSGCVLMILEIPFTRQVGPLPAGPYSLALTHTSTSPRHGDSACSSWMPFEVTCCAQLPAEVTDLRVDVAIAGSTILLGWSDFAEADDYVVFGASAADGPFTSRLQVAASGESGANLPVEALPAFFVVGARNACGVGPRH